MTARRTLPALPLLLAAFCALSLPVVLLGMAGQGGLAFDAVTFHLPQINHFVHHPGDVLNYPATATTLPFYHAFMGLVARGLGLDAVGNDMVIMRLAHWAISGLGLVVLAQHLLRHCGPANALLLGLPFMTSWYVVAGAIYFGTDGPALSVLLIAMLAAGCSGWAGQACAMVLMVATRHLLLPFLAAIYGITALAKRSVPAVLMCGLAAVPAAGLLSIYVAHWGGLTPPGMVASLNPKGVFPYTLIGHLSVVAIWGVGFGALRVAEWMDLLQRRKVRLAILAAVLMVAGIWAGWPTDPSVEGGRHGSIAWQLARFGLVGHHAPLLLLMACGGAASLVLLGFDLARQGQVPTHIIALAGFLCTLMLTYAGYQRYCEPAILAALTLTTAALTGTTPIARWQQLPLIALILASTANTIAHLVK